jgi:hypothetical protein
MAYEGHPNLVTPLDDTVVWRYMDVLKLLDILENSRLWFARMDLQDDPREGGLTEIELKQLRDARSHEKPEVHEALLRAYEKMRRKWFLNCWTECSESMAMWDLYAGSRGGVAIKSTVGRLKSALNIAAEGIYITRAEYMGWSTTCWSNCLVGMYFRKAFGFVHEREVRMMIYQEDSGDLPKAEREQWQQLRDTLFLLPSQLTDSERKLCRRILSEAEDAAALRSTKQGVFAQIETSKLIEEIIVGPRSAIWHELVSSVVQRYGIIKDKVRRSELTYSPLAASESWA